MSADTLLNPSESQADLRDMLLDALPYGIALLDEHFNFVYHNPVFPRILGYGAENLIQKNLLKTFFPHTARQQEEFEHLIQFTCFISKLYTKDQGYVPFRYSIAPTLTPSGGKGWIFSVATVDPESFDLVSRNADLSEQLAIQKQELQASKTALDEFCFSISHDLRAPLRAIDGFSQAVLDDYDEVLDDQGREYLGRVRKASQKMSQLIDAMLKLSRLAREPMHPEPCNLSSMASQILEQLASESPDRKIHFEVEPNIQAHGDPRMLHTLLKALLENAWKYTQKCDLTSITFASQSSDEEIVCCIRDNGVGFDPAYSNKLFKPFERLHTEPEYAGSGTGLATAHTLIERHSGRIWAESAPDMGAAFYFTLPKV